MRVAAGLMGAALAVGALTFPAGAARAGSGAPGPSASALFSYTDPQITESSGIAASSFDDSFYTHNDSGDSARFFRVDVHGNTVAVYTLRGATNVDWEDMATGTDAAGHRVLYFGDIGDNDRKRNEIAVYRVPEPRGASSNVAWVRYRFAYPDGAHDAEALLVNPRDHRIYIATKTLLGSGELFEAPQSLSTTGVNLLVAVGTVPALTTSADFSPDGTRIVLLTYVGAFWSDAVGGTWKRFDVPLPHQAEAIAYARGGSSVLVGGEGTHSVVYETAAPSTPSASPRSTISPRPPPSQPPSPSPLAAARPSPGVPIGVVILLVVAPLAVIGILALRWRRNR